MGQGSPGFVGERLRQARTGRGIGVEELADMVGVTRQSISQYERGPNTPSPETLYRIASTLGFPIGFFVKPLEDHFYGRPVFYRSLKSVRASDRERAESHLEWLGELVNYTSAYIEFPSLTVPHGLLESMPEKLKDVTDDLIEGVAAQLRSYWRLDDAPISNVMRLLEANGFVIALDSITTDKLDGLSNWSRNLQSPFILLNRGIESAARQRFSTCHELGHLILHYNLPSAVAFDNELMKTLDKQVNKFASAFLLPKGAFLADVYSVTLESLKHLKLKWKVSIAAMIERLRELGRITTSNHKSLRAALSRYGWLRSEPYDNDLPREEPVLLKQAFQMIAEEKFEYASRLEYEINLDEKTITRLSNLPEDFFKQPETPNNILRFIA